MNRRATSKKERQERCDKVNIERNSNPFILPCREKPPLPPERARIESFFTASGAKRSAADAAGADPTAAGAMKVRATPNHITSGHDRRTPPAVARNVPVVVIDEDDDDHHDSNDRHSVSGRTPTLHTATAATVTTSSASGAMPGDAATTATAVIPPSTSVRELRDGDAAAAPAVSEVARQSGLRLLEALERRLGR